MRASRDGRRKPLAVRVFALFMSVVFALGGVPATGIAQANADVDLLDAQEVVQEDGTVVDGGLVDEQSDDGWSEWVDAEAEEPGSEDGFGPADELVEEEDELAEEEDGVADEEEPTEDADATDDLVLDDETEPADEDEGIALDEEEGGRAAPDESTSRDPQAEGVRSLASSELRFYIYTNHELRIGWDLPETYNGYSKYAGWYSSYDYYSDDNQYAPWASNYSGYVTKITVVNTVEVKNGKDMFRGMSALVSADLSKLDVSNCSSTESMFYGCSKLKTLNISGWSMHSMTVTSMYEGCTSLSTVKVGSGVYWSGRLPEYSVNGHTDWYSSADKTWYTADQIYYSRDRIADTYSKSIPVKRDISKSACTASIGTMAWTGGQRKPNPTVKWKGTKLTKGKHYKIVAYGTNKNNGTKGNWVKIQGIGSYKGTRTVKFRIRKPNVLYYGRRAGTGWEKKYSRKNGTKSGGAGKSKRLEGIRIKLSNKPVSGTIKYRTYSGSYGWEKNWRTAGKTSGATSKTKRIEAIQIKLTGRMAKKYDVWYRVYTPKFGWMGWAKNGAKAGTSRYPYRLESIQIVLKPKGKSAPPARFKSANRKTAAAFKRNPGKTYTYKMLRDTWSFANYRTYITRSKFIQMYGSSRGERLYNKTHNGRADGVCYGFSASVGAMVKHKYPKVSSFGASKINALSQYSYTSSLGMYATDYIEYCFLTQYDYRLLAEMYKTKNNYSGLVNAVKKHQYGGTAIEIDLMGKGGHSVFPLKITSNTSTKTVIAVYDSNRPSAAQNLVLYKSGGRYTGFSYPYGGFTWLAWETPADNVKSFMAGGNAVYKGATNDMNLISTDTDLVVTSGGRTYRLSADNTSDLDNVIPVLEKGGTGEVTMYWVGFDTSDMKVQSLSKNAEFSVATDAGSVEVSAKEGATVTMSVGNESTSKNSVTIDGKKGDAFSVTYREDNGDGKIEETEVSGLATGEVVETTLEDTGKVDVKGGTLD